MVTHTPLYQTSQCLSKWQSGFGSTALVMMINFFLRLDKDIDIAVANYLRTDHHFLCEDDAWSQRGYTIQPFSLNSLQELTF